ncbi:hypothetical protein SNEBB_005351 [Seison nebaliae]|nr:hypothetical protein SNEBB_005351 [Seison nebaliae]
MSETKTNNRPLSQISTIGGGDRSMNIPFGPPLLTADKIEEKWQILETAIREILNQNNDLLSFETLYRNGYIMVINKAGDKLYNGLQTTIKEYLLKEVCPKILKMITTNSKNFLQELNESFHNYKMSLGMIKDILMYLDKKYLRQRRLDSVEHIGYKLFRNYIIGNDRIAPTLTKTLLNQIDRERKNGRINREVILKSCKMLMTLGIETRDVYRINFEEPFLKQSEEFYRSEALRYIAFENASRYLRNVRERFDEEKCRAKLYLDPSTEQFIVKVLEKELISNHLQQIIDMPNSGVYFMLKFNHTDMLNLMYTLLKTVPNGISSMCEALSKYIQEEGIELASKSESKVEPVVYIQSLIDFRDRFTIFLEQSFKKDKIFMQQINRDFEKFINMNKRTPEYLSLFIDDKLKKGVKGFDPNDQHLEEILNKSMILFRYLEAKDAFEGYYKLHLGKRLLISKTLNDEAENSMISKLKTECGCQFTSKLEGMFKDITLSESTSKIFAKALKEEHIELPIGFSCRVLTTGLWPVTRGTNDKVILPKVAEKAFSEFKNFYLEKHNGRVLTIRSDKGTVEMTAKFHSLNSQSSGKAPKTDETTYELIGVSTSQMVLLMLFNEHSQLSIDQLEEMTKLERIEIMRAITSLRKCKPQPILISTGKDDNGTIGVNTNFVSKSKRVKITQLTYKLETEPERKEIDQKVEEDRKHEVEASIIRLMKSRKIMESDSIITDVTKQLQNSLKELQYSMADTILSLQKNSNEALECFLEEMLIESNNTYNSIIDHTLNKFRYRRYSPSSDKRKIKSMFVEQDREGRMIEAERAVLENLLRTSDLKTQNMVETIDDYTESITRNMDQPIQSMSLRHNANKLIQTLTGLVTTINQKKKRSLDDNVDDLNENSIMNHLIHDCFSHQLCI